MKTNHFKKAFLWVLVSAAILTVPSVKAQTFNGVFNYNTEDVLLVFSSDTYDSIYFDLGPVAQFLNHTNGYQVQVTNWDPSVVETYLGSFPSEGGYLPINFNLGAGTTSSPYGAWATYTADPTLSLLDAYEVGVTINDNGGNLNGLSENGPVDSQTPQVGDVFATNYVVLSPKQNIAWDYKNNDNGWASDNNYISGGSFSASIPGGVAFYQFAPNATTQVGTFQFTADGRLFFTVGSILNKTTITNFAYDDVTEADVTFNTVIGANYRLLETTNLALPFSSWTVDTAAIVDYPNGGTSTGSVLGDGSPHTLSDLNATNTPAFYSIESF